MRPEAHVPPCPRCGAPLPIDLEAAQVVCRACGAGVGLDARLRDAMLRYVGDARAALKRDLEARFDAAFYRQNELAATSFVLGAVGVAVSLTGLLMAFVLTRAFATKVSWILSVALVGVWLVSLVAFVKGWRLIFLPVTTERLSVVETAICAGCGATTGFEASQATRTCRHCGGTALVPSHVAQSLLARARTAAEQSSVAEVHALAVASAAGDRWIVPSVVGIVVVVTTAVVGIAVFGQPTGFALPTWALGVAFGASFAAALPTIVGSVRAAGRARRALDGLLEGLQAGR